MTRSTTGRVSGTVNNSQVVRRFSGCEALGPSPSQREGLGHKNPRPSGYWRGIAQRGLEEVPSELQIGTTS
jgi:hypothetical protein